MTVTLVVETDSCLFLLVEKLRQINMCLVVCHANLWMNLTGIVLFFSSFFSSLSV